jgi:trimethylamine--corrinoid protein Co-methyltransferase
MNAGVMGSYAQMLIDNDIISSVNRAVRGFDVNEDSLALEVISSVMDGARNFLAEKHTINYLRAGEIAYTELGERRSFDEWDRTGRKGMAERAHANAVEIIANHEVLPLRDDQEKELNKILLAAEKELTSAN